MRGDVRVSYSGVLFALLLLYLSQWYFSISCTVTEHVEIVSMVCVGSGHYDARRYIGKSPSKPRSPLLGQLRPP